MTDRWEALTPVEREIAEAIVAGRTRQEIAADFGCSSDGIRYHLRRLVVKLELPLPRSAAPSTYTKAIRAYAAKRAA